MTQAAASPLATDRCPRCGGAFHCGINGPGPCACTTVSLSPEQLAEVGARHAGCLCLSCLQQIADGAPVVIPPADEWLIACLCADWCQICQTWQPTFERLSSDLSSKARVLWVDIEDEEDTLGPVEVDDFPTLLVARGDEVLFFGTIRAEERSVVQVFERARRGELVRVEDRRLAGLPGRLRGLERGR